jgi:hypothetical protein
MTVPAKQIQGDITDEMVERGAAAIIRIMPAGMPAEVAMAIARAVLEAAFRRDK